MSAPAFKDKRSGTAVTLGLLAGLSFPSALLSAAETGPHLIPPANNSILAQNALSHAERMALLSHIRKLATVSPEDAVQWSETVKSELACYRNALRESPDFSLEELKEAQHIAIYELNIHPFYGKLPQEVRQQFMAENILTLHAALIERITIYAQQSPEQVSLEPSAKALLGDILWSDAFQSQLILQHAAKLYGERIFNCSSDLISGRIRHFTSEISSNPKLASDPGLFDIALRFTLNTLIRDGAGASPESVQELNVLCLSFQITPQQAEILAKTSKEYIGRSDSQIALGRILGPLCGAALIGPPASQQRYDKALQAVALFDSVLSREKQQTGQKELSQLSSGALLISAALQHALSGHYADDLGGPKQIRTWADVQRSEELRLAAFHFSLGVLSGLDKAVCNECRPYSDESTNAGENKTSEDKGAGPFEALKASREAFRTALGIATSGAWSDERRGEIVAALLASDFSRHEFALEAVEYMNHRRKELGKYFPDVRVASREGRYASKVGEVRYFPPVQVKGEPSAYADLYFYTREALVTHRHHKSWLDLDTPDKELDQLALNYAEAHQMIFITNLISALWGSSPEQRPHEDHRGLSDERMSKEILTLLKDFPCFNNDLLLSYKLGNTPGAKFMAEVEKLRTDAIRTKLELEPRIEAILKEK